jgi:glycerol-3-phosphate dehydrogenase
MNLGPAYRRGALQRLRDERFDVVIVGGGVVGCGAALDAATRGLNVAVVEARDFAAGTSSRSSKLLHGGLRYLEQGRVELVREALRERALLLERLCPHLARPVPILAPLQRRGLDRAYLGAGIALYDLLGGARDVPRHRHLSRRGTLRVAPALRPDAVSGGILFHDGQIDDARHTVTLARTAAHHGAAVLSSTRAEGFVRAGERVVGVRVRDVESREQIEVRGRVVVNAAGVWTDELQQMLGIRARFRIRASKGVHLVVPRDRIQADAGLLLRTQKSVLFVIPWGSCWLVGTTDTPWDLDLAHPAASRADIDYLLGCLNRVLRSPITRADIIGVYVGLRPLVAGDGAETTALSREHSVGSPVAGLVTVAGGKYTTYRVMARDAVDAAVAQVGRSAPPSCTHEVPLLGADGWRSMHNARERLADRSGLHVARVEHLLGRYGSETASVLDLIASEPGLARALPGAEDHLAAEVRWAVVAEGALHADDVLARRTRISIDTPDRGVTAVEAVAGLMAPTLGWDDADIGRETAAYRDRVRAERRSQDQPTDEMADLERTAAVDLRPSLSSAAIG